jgi:ribosome-associated protein
LIPFSSILPLIVTAPDGIRVTKMKEQEKAEIKRLSDMLDALNHKDVTVIQQGVTELIDQHMKEKEKLAAEIERLRNVRVSKLSVEAQKLAGLPFSREITKKEQADMGTLKKTVRGIVVVHPMTALGREMGLKVVTGYAKKAF